MFPKRFIITALSALLIIAATIVVIKYAEGYRPGKQTIIQGTGLLAANSFPNGAQVYINGKLSTATDSTMNLDPGEYDIEVRKDGFTTWKKRLKIEKELVAQTNAVLFPTAPTLSPLTFTGAMNVTPSPDGQKLAFVVASASAELKNGIYVLDLSDSLLSLQRGVKQIVEDGVGFNFPTATLTWSPDSSELLLSSNGRTFLLDPTRLNKLVGMQDISSRLPRLLSEWEQELYTRERARLQKFPEAVQYIATASAKNIYFSPDEERILYTATASGALADRLISPVLAANSQPQERTLKSGKIYVYDRKEDRNFLVGSDQIEAQLPYTINALANDLYSDKPRTLEASPAAFKRLQTNTSLGSMRNFTLYYSGALAGSLQWFPDSKHLIGIQNGSIVIFEYDNTNITTIFAGPFSEHFVYPWPNGSKLVILTNFNAVLKQATNLYAVSLK